MKATTKKNQMHERAIRRLAERAGLRLERSRTRDPNQHDYGRCRLVDGDTGEAMTPWLTLGEIEQLIGTD